MEVQLDELDRERFEEDEEDESSKSSSSCAILRFSEAESKLSGHEDEAVGKVFLHMCIRDILASNESG